MAHAQKPDFVFRAKRTSPFKSARWGRQFSRLLAAEVCAISGSNAGYTMFRGSVKTTGYPLHSPVSPLISPSRASPRAITFQLESNIAALNKRILLESWVQTAVQGKIHKEFSLTLPLPYAAGVGVGAGGVDVEAWTSDP